MATYVNDLRLKEIATGDESGTWGTSTNTNLELIGEAFSFGTEAISTNADTHTTTIADGATDPGRSIFLKYTGALDSDCTVTIGPNTVSKLWFIENATTDSGSSGPYNIIIKQGSGATVTIRNGDVKAIYSDGAGSGGKMVDAFTDLHVNGLTSEVTGNDAAFTVRSTDADASAGPLIVFDRESSSPAASDLLGSVVFKGENDASESITYARIRAEIIDASDGSEDGLFQLAAAKNGSVTSRIEMNATEIVFNQGSKDLDFRVETDGNANMGFAEGSTNRVGIGTSSPSTELEVAGDITAISSGPSIFLTDSDNNPDYQIKNGNGTFRIIDATNSQDRINCSSTETVINESSSNLHFRVETNNNENMLFISGSTDRMLINTATNVAVGAVNADLQYTGTANASTQFSMARFSDGSGSSSIRFAKSRSGTVGTFTAINNGDNIGVITFCAADGTDAQSKAADIIGEAAAGAASNDTPGALVFRVTADGSDSVTEAMRIDDTGFLGIGTSSPATRLDVNGGLHGDHATFSSVAGRGLKISTESRSGQNDGIGVIDAQDSEGDKGIISLQSAGTETARVTTTQILIGQTSGSAADEGVIFQKSGNIFATADGGTSGLFRRLTNNGEVIRISKGATTCGSIGVNNTAMFLSSPTGNDSGLKFGDRQLVPCTTAGASRDDAINLGSSSNRFDTIFAKSSTINTSDRNEKQDIEELSDAEKRVAVAAKGLLRKYRWKSAVEAKGDNARIHVGIIAQDLQEAFTAEGLDAARYGMWCSDTFWVDSEGETYDTQEEAPEGATEQTRLGVRYDELLAFIISTV